MSDLDWFYFFQDGETYGPFTLDEMAAQARAGKINRNALACRAGEESWSEILNHDFLGHRLSKPFTDYLHQVRLRETLDALLIAGPVQRDLLIEHLNGVKVFYGSPVDRKGPISLWQVLDLIDAGVLPLETSVCVDGSDYWRDAIMVCAGKS